MLDRSTRALALVTVAWLVAIGGVVTSAIPARGVPGGPGEPPLAHASAKAPTKSVTRITGWSNRSRLVTPDRPIQVSLRVRSAGGPQRRSVLIQRANADSSRWTTVKRLKTRPKGNVVLLIRPDRKPYADREQARVGYRVVVPATRRSRPATTDPTWVTVVPNGLPGPVQLVSSNSQGQPGNGASSSPAVSPDGTQVAFTSTSTNLAGQPVTGRQVYVKDLRTGAVTLVSASTSGVPGDGDSDSAAWSPDSRQVVFASKASNLGVVKGKGDLWIKEIPSGKLRHLISTGLDWAVPMPPRLSAFDTPVLWSPHGSTILAHISADAATGFDCILGTEAYPTPGTCAYGLGAIDAVTGTATMIRDGRYEAYASINGVPETLPRAWSPDGRRFTADLRHPCYHCEGSRFATITSAGDMEGDLLECASYKDGCDASLSGWRSDTELAYSYFEESGRGFLSGIRLEDVASGSYRSVPVPRFALSGDSDLADFSPDGSRLALAAAHGWSRTVQSLDVTTGEMATWLADPSGTVPQPRPGGYREADWGPQAADPHWVSDRAMVFVTGNPLVPGDSNGVDDIVLKTMN